MDSLCLDSNEGESRNQNGRKIVMGHVDRSEQLDVEEGGSGETSQDNSVSACGK